MGHSTPHPFNSRVATIVAACLLTLLPALAMPTRALASDGHHLFMSSAVEHADNTVTLPLHRGLSHGSAVYYLILDASDGATADLLGVNHAAKLRNAADTGAVQHVSRAADGLLVFPATVDFRPERQVTPGPQGFPPAVAQPGAIGEKGYSPLIQLPEGTILNAPQIANDSGQADKVVRIDTVAMTVTYRETNGFQGGKPVRYLSTDASDSVAAALENATYAPALNGAPRVGDDSTASARASLAAFTNGQLGAANPQRQGLNSAILDGLDPLNVLRWNPSQGRYSPLWDVHLAEWAPAATTSGRNVRQTDFGQVQHLAEDGLVGSFGGGAFDAAGFIVDCPIVSLR